MEDLDEKETFDESDEENVEEYYEWNMIPITYSEEKKTGVTFKGDTDEYFRASKKIFKMMDIKGMKYSINDREIRILGNLDSKPIKVEVKPIKGPSGKVNIKIYGVNKQGHATMMIQKVSGGNMTHVKTVAFKVIKYLLDGIIDGEIEDQDIENMKCLDSSNKKDSPKCVLCKKTFKTERGSKIHSRKCTETFLSEDDLKLHMQTAHVSKPKNECPICGYRAKSYIDFNRHNRDKHDKTTSSTSPKPKKRKKDIKNEEDMETSDSTAKSMQIEDLTKEGEVFWMDARSDIGKDVEMKIFQERSDNKDEKIRMKDKQTNEKEAEYERNKEKGKNDKDIEDKKRKNQKKIEKKKTKTKQKKGEKERQNDVLKPHLRALPPAVKKIVGEDYVLFPVDGDGACGPRSFAAWIYEDPTLGPHLARNMNRLFVEHWNYWSDKFSYPFIWNIGLGKEIKCENEKELLKFFLDSEEGAFMWRGHEDFAIIANAYQIKITIITVRGMQDKHPEIKVIEPNPEFEKYAEISSGKIPDMVILHEHNVHYSLIIPKNSRLAENGSLDLQRSEIAKVVEKNEDKIVDKSSMKEKGMEISLNSNVVSEGKDCNGSEIENSSQKTSTWQLNEDEIIVSESFHENVSKEDTSKGIIQDEFTLNAGNERKLQVENRSPNNPGEKNIQHEVLVNASNVGKHTDERITKNHINENAMLKFESFEARMVSLEKSLKLLMNRCEVIEKENRYLKEVIKDKETKKLEKEEKVFEEQKDDTQNEEEILFQQKRRGFKRVGPFAQSEPQIIEKEYPCDVCGYILESLGLLNAHKKIHTSKSAHNCLKCDEKFGNENDLRSHIEAKHRDSVTGNKISRQFNCLDCSFQAEKSLELKKHVMRTQHKPCEYTENCYTCGKEFKSYFYLMTHKKEEHPSNRTCRYFLTNSCIFSEKECWFKHKNKAEEEKNKEIIEEDASNEVFQKAPNKAPPDQMNLLGEIIKQMTIQMKNLEMINKMI